MKIHRKEVSGGIERQFLTGAVVSDRFLKEARSFYDPELLDTRYVRTVAEWCFGHFGKYQKAPGLHIRDIYAAHSDQMDPAEAKLIAGLLASLSDEYERAAELNVPYLLDQAEGWFKRLSLERTARTVAGLAAQGDVTEAEAELAGYKRVGRPATLGENPFKSSDDIQRAFERSERPLFALPGALGRMMNGVLNRDQFIAFMGPEKRGKTWWLNELAIRAAMSRLNVVLFQVGDMSREQVVLRICIRLAGRSNMERYAGDQVVPVLDCRLNQLGTCKRCPHKNKPLMDDWSPLGAWEAYESGLHRRYRACSECEGEKFFKGAIWYNTVHIKKELTWREAWRESRKFLGRIKGRDFRLFAFPSDQLTITEIKAMIDNLESFEGFIPDVVVIDYADNLAPEDRREEFRHQQNRTWKLLRGLSLERHCLVVTATQAAGRSYKKASLEMDDYSEDKRKYAHVTGMFGLNQTPDEKRAGLMRINTIVLREEEFHIEDEVTVGQALRLGRPLVCSY